MNTIMMVTAVAGTIVGNAWFTDMDECLAARAKVISQPDVTASCIITQKEEDKSAVMFRMFSDIMGNMATAQEETLNNSKPR